MKLWALAGLFTVAAVPFAGAAEASSECQVDDTRRTQHVRIDGGSPGGSAPVQTAQPTVAPREAAAEQSVQRDPAPARSTAERRRNGKQIPDAELIAPRRTL
jgi:hypothetical protein